MSDMNQDFDSRDINVEDTGKLMTSSVDGGSKLKIALIASTVVGVLLIIAGFYLILFY